jgi:hypothetical protein
VGIDKAVKPDFLKYAQRDSWVYLIFPDAEAEMPVALVEMVEEEDRLRIRRACAHDESVESIWKTYNKCKAVLGLRKEKFEVRILKVVFLRINAMWLHSSSERFFILAPAFHGFVAGEEETQFVKRVTRKRPT